MRGVKCGQAEIDLLALRQTGTALERWHIEVQTSFRPIGSIGGVASARRRSSPEVREGVEQWVNKKFKDARKSEPRDAIAPGGGWSYVLVHANVRHQEELAELKACGVKLVWYRRILADLMEDKSNTSSSIASNIVDILRFVKSIDSQSSPRMSAASE